MGQSIQEQTKPLKNLLSPLLNTLSQISIRELKSSISDAWQGHKHSFALGVNIVSIRIGEGGISTKCSFKSI